MSRSTTWRCDRCGKIEAPEFTYSFDYPIGGAMPRCIVDLCSVCEMQLREFLKIKDVKPVPIGLRGSDERSS